MSDLRCSKCEETKDTSQFYRENNKRGYRYLCIPCCKVVIKQYRNENPRTQQRNERARHFVLKYGISVRDYERMLVEQDNKCAVCKVDQNDLTRKLAVDHDHKTNAVRQLLCPNCNAALGMVSENIEILENLIRYLRKYKEQQ